MQPNINMIITDQQRWDIIYVYCYVHRHRIVGDYLHRHVCHNTGV